MAQRIGAQEVGVQATASCAECNQDGLDVTLDQEDDKNWKLTMKVNNFNQLLKNQRTINGKRYEVEILMQGKGQQKSEVMSVTTTISAR